MCKCKLFNNGWMKKRYVFGFAQLQGAPSVVNLPQIEVGLMSCQSSNKVCMGQTRGIWQMDWEIIEATKCIKAQSQDFQ